MDTTAVVVASAPGRVNLIGEHLDYNGGRCLPIAIPQRTTARVALRDDDTVRVTSGERRWSGAVGSRAPGWAAYVGGVLWALEVQLPLEISLSSDVPVGAGLSSSAALECSVALAVDELLGLGLSADELAAACVRAETEYVGAPTGGLDQAAALFCRPRQALLLDFTDHSREPVPFDPAADGLSLLVVDTRVSHDLVESGYGDRRGEAEAARDRLGVSHLAAADPADVDRLPEPLDRRTRHVLTEQARVTALADAAGRRDWASCGELMTASHVSLRDDYEVSSDELDRVVEVALEHGALGARMTGGGFGGSAIALVPADRVPAVGDAVTDAFRAEGWERPGLLAVEASGAASVDRPRGGSRG